MHLAQGDLQAFQAVVPFKQAGGQGQRDLVGVVEPVHAGEFVVGEHLVQGQVLQGAVEDGNAILVFVGDIEVIFRNILM